MKVWQIIKDDCVIWIATNKELEALPDSSVIVTKTDFTSIVPGVDIIIHD